MQQDHNCNFGIHLDVYSFLANTMFSNYHQILNSETVYFETKV